jgi:hypothetical protein
MLKTIRTLAASFAAMALLGACSVLGLDDRERLGIIWPPGQDHPQVVVPQTAQAGQLFTVTVTTIGGGCLRMGPTRVRTRGMSAEVRPYDVHNGGNVCPTDVQPFEHTATLRFDQPGTATVTFHGRGSPEVVITRTVTIQ